MSTLSAQPLDGGMCNLCPSWRSFSSRVLEWDQVSRIPRHVTCQGCSFPSYGSPSLLPRTSLPSLSDASSFASALPLSRVAQGSLVKVGNAWPCPHWVAHQQGTTSHPPESTDLFLFSQTLGDSFQGLKSGSLLAWSYTRHASLSRVIVCCRFRLLGKKCRTPFCPTPQFCQHKQVRGCELNEPKQERKCREKKYNPPNLKNWPCHTVSACLCHH